MLGRSHSPVPGDFRRVLASMVIAACLHTSAYAAPAHSDADTCVNGSGDAAIAACTRAIGSGKFSGSDLAFYYLDRGFGYRAKNDYDRAIADFSQAIKISPDYAQAFYNRGYAYMLKENYDRAMADYNEAIRLDPKFAGFYVYRGDVYDLMGDHDRAIADYTQTITLDPKNVQALLNRGVVYSNLNDFEHAIADLNEALRLEPKNGEAYITRGSAFLVKGDYDRALTDLNQAIRFDPKNAAAYHKRGTAYSLKSDFDHALADYTQAIALDPKFAHAYIGRGDIWSAKGDQDRAIADASAAIRIDPTIPYGYQDRCEYLTIKGEAARALPDCEEALRRFNPNKNGPICNTGPILYSCHAQLFFDRGRVYELSSEFAKALDDFRAALALDTKDKYKAEAVARMEKKLAAVAAPKPAVATPAAVSPAAPVVAETRVALVIGNSKYQNAGTLTNPKNDATAVAATLKRIGFTKVTLLLDLPREKLVDALGTFSRDASHADWALVYYAGHGLELGGVNYLVPVDAKLASDRDASFQTVTLDQAMQAVEGSKKIHIIILDACRDNPFASTMTRSMASTRSISRGLAPIEPDGGTIVAYAAKHGQTAEDGQTGNSPFATALMKNLDTPGLEISLLFRKVRDDVLAATERRQEPFVYGSLPSDLFYFRAP